MEQKQVYSMKPLLDGGILAPVTLHKYMIYETTRQLSKRKGAFKIFSEYDMFNFTHRIKLQLRYEIKHIISKSTLIQSQGSRQC